MNKALMKTMQSNLINLPTPVNISYWWNFGSLLGMFLMIQLISGIILSMHYCPNVYMAFQSMIHITQNINNGWLLHFIHMNGASMFFICMYIHMGRGMYYHSYNLKYTWLSGVTIFIISMATAFLGYVLPWGQMSYWGATVITNLVTAIPYMGTSIIEWIWGGYSINNATLNRFFSLHFIMPFIIMMFIILHLLFLHETGSKNPIGLNSNFYKIPFNYYFTLKDLYGFILLFFLFMIINLQYPFTFNDPDNFIEANPIITPTHIQPEWYFLFAYAILRSIPNKLGGIIALMSSLLILYSMKWMNYHMKSNTFYPFNQLLYWMFINNFIILTFMGCQAIEPPYMMISQISSIMYFLYFILSNYSFLMWDKLILTNK